MALSLEDEILYLACLDDKKLSHSEWVHAILLIDAGETPDGFTDEQIQAVQFIRLNSLQPNTTPLN